MVVPADNICHKIVKWDTYFLWCHHNSKHFCFRFCSRSKHSFNIHSLHTTQSTITWIMKLHLRLRFGSLNRKMLRMSRKQIMVIVQLKANLFVGLKYFLCTITILVYRIKYTLKLEGCKSNCIIMMPFPDQYACLVWYQNPMMYLTNCNPHLQPDSQTALCLMSLHLRWSKNCQRLSATQNNNYSWAASLLNLAHWRSILKYGDWKCLIFNK